MTAATSFGPIWITCPERMSHVNVFYALAHYALNYRAILEQKTLKDLPEGINTAQKVDNLFKQVLENPNPAFPSKKLFIGVIEGVSVIVDFSKFPEINVRGYEDAYGEKAASLTLEKYAATLSKTRFDKKDYFWDPSFYEKINQTLSLAEKQTMRAEQKNSEEDAPPTLTGIVWKVLHLGGS